MREAVEKFNFNSNFNSTGARGGGENINENVHKLQVFNFNAKGARGGGEGGEGEKLERDRRKNSACHNYQGVRLFLID